VDGPVVSSGTLNGLRALTLENARLRVTVLPEAGGHVVELVDLQLGRDLLWHNPRTAPRPAPYGAYFDDWWSGGWDEIFPSGDRGTLHGEPLPYMGELWCVPWMVEAWSGGGEAALVGHGFGTVAAARFERRLSLRGDEPILRASYRIENLDVRPLPFTWGIHPVFAVTPDHRIDLPAGRMLVGVSSDPSMGSPGEAYRWPTLPDPSLPSGERDMRRPRPREDAVFAGHWATDLQAGWVAITDTATRRGLAIAFDPSVFRHAWLWQVYGGWRGHHHLAIEPWTSHPQQLEDAVSAGRARVLAPGETLETEVAFVLHAGLASVDAVLPAGDGYEVRQPLSPRAAQSSGERNAITTSTTPMAIATQGQTRSASTDGTAWRSRK
jgi:galactose mutarotase-like enzyme